MKTTSIPYVRRYAQEGRKPMNDEISRDGFWVKKERHSKAFMNYIDSVIREYATLRNDCFELHINSLPLCEKKIFLSYLVYPADYEDYVSSPTLCEMAIEEYSNQMQIAIDDNICQYYHDWVRNAGFDE